MQRRQFIQGSASLASMLMLPSWAHGHRFDYPTYDLMDSSPTEKLSAFGGSSIVEGDAPDEAHEIFWNKLGFIQKKGGIPKVTGHYDVVIVGGGISGLSSAYHLKGKKILVLEGNARFGGNSRSQQFQKSYASQGAAYITNFEPHDEIDQFISNLGIKKFMRSTSDLDEGVNLKGVIHKNFWQGTTDPKNAQEFIHARAKFHDIYENKFPELPTWDQTSSGRTYFNSLDQITLADWLKREIGTSHPHILEYITLYCWSSFSASPSEISAAQGLNFLACDLEGINVFPGGNGFIAQALYDKLKSQSQVTLKPQSFAVDVRNLGGKAQICYKNPAGTLETVTATKCIVASPKLVAKHIVEDLPALQRKAMDGITYRAYLVANIFMKKKLPSQGFDIFSLMGTNPTDGYNDSKNRTFADVVFADWAMKDVADKTILTLYMPLPYDMAQQYLFVDDLQKKYEARIREKISTLINWNDVEGMRLVRYGHSMPVATKGLVANGTFERASADIDGCIYFVNQDNWGNACFETSYGSALNVIRKI